MSNSKDAQYAKILHMLLPVLFDYLADSFKNSALVIQDGGPESALDKHLDDLVMFASPIQLAIHYLIMHKEHIEDVEYFDEMFKAMNEMGAFDELDALTDGLYKEFPRINTQQMGIGLSILQVLGNQQTGMAANDEQ